MKLNPIPLVRSWLTGEAQNHMSKPTLTDWYKHIPTYGGVALMMLVQTAILLVLLRVIGSAECSK